MRLFWFERPEIYTKMPDNHGMAYRISGKALVTIGRKMKSARKAGKRTQVEVADEAGIDPSYYARIERGEANPSLEVLNAIVKALHAKSSDILPF